MKRFGVVAACVVVFMLGLAIAHWLDGTRKDAPSGPTPAANAPAPDAAKRAIDEYVQAKEKELADRAAAEEKRKEDEAAAEKARAEIAKAEADKLLQAQLAQRAEEERQREVAAEAQRRQAAAIQDTMQAYANEVGKRLMQQLGGGQDLVVNVIRMAVVGGQYQIDMDVSFNGSINRDNNYQVSGRLTVDKDGQNPTFARTGCNQAFKDQESTVLALRIFGELVKDANKK